MKKRLVLAFILGISCLLTALFPFIAQAENHLSADESRRYDVFFLEAIRQRELENYGAAFELMQHALQINPKASEALYELAQLYEAFFSDKRDTTQLLIARASALEPDNMDYKMALADLYIRRKNMDAAVRTYEEMATKNPTRSDLLATLVQLYEEKDDYEAVVRTLDRLEVIEGKSEMFSMEKVKVFLKQGNEKAAFAEIDKLCEAYPGELRFRSVRGDLLLQAGDTALALATFRNILHIEPENVYAQLSLLAFYQLTGQDTLYRTSVRQLVLNPKQETEARIQAMKSLIQSQEQKGNDTTEVLTLFRDILLLPQEDRALEQLCLLYLEIKQLSPATKTPFIDRILTLDPGFYEARIQRISIALSQSDAPCVIQLCDEGVRYDPQKPALYFFKGVAFCEQKKTHEALKSFRDCLERTDEETDPVVMSHYYSSLADVLIETRQKEAAYAAYDSALNYSSENRTCLNNYAYYLSIDGKMLDKAEKMSLRTVKEEPTNPTYLDTYAWILFMKKEYDKAKIYIDETLKYIDDEQNNGTLYEHAGDIYWHTNNRDEALKYWEQALKENHESLVLKRKIRQNKYSK